MGWTNTGGNSKQRIAFWLRMYWPVVLLLIGVAIIAIGLLLTPDVSRYKYRSAHRATDNIKEAGIWITGFATFMLCRAILVRHLTPSRFKIVKIVFFTLVTLVLLYAIWWIVSIFLMAQGLDGWEF